MNRILRRTTTSGIVALAGILTLSGCVPSPDQQLLESGTAVEAPASMGTDQVANIDPDRVRFLGEDSEGRTFYLAPASEQPGMDGAVCLLIDGIENGPVLGCGRMPLEVGSSGVSARLTMFPEEDAGGERIGDHLVVFG